MAAYRFRVVDLTGEVVDGFVEDVSPEDVDERVTAVAATRSKRLVVELWPPGAARPVRRMRGARL